MFRPHSERWNDITLVANGYQLKPHDCSHIHDPRDAIRVHDTLANLSDQEER